MEQAECMRKRNVYKQRRPRSGGAERGVSSWSALFTKISTLIVMTDYQQKKFLYDQALIHFALIGDKSSKGDTSSQILSKINIGSTHTFKHIRSRIHQNCDRIFPYFCPNVYANAFLRIRSYAPTYTTFNYHVV